MGTVEPASVEGVARVLNDAPLQSQFCLPRGVLGRVVGWVMSRENERMNRATVDLLRAGPQDHVLELGFGPGQAIELWRALTLEQRGQWRPTHGSA